MLAAQLLDTRLARETTLRLKGEAVECTVLRFPNAKLMVIASSDGDGRVGKAVLHSNELVARTKGATQYMELSNSFRLQSQLEHIIEGSIEEERILKLRVGELTTAYTFLMRCGPLTENDPKAKEIISLLVLIQNDLAEPKRNQDKLAASRNIGKGLAYRSPKAKHPVGPVTAITVKAARTRVESRIREIREIRNYMRPLLELVRSFNKDAEKLFKSLKDEKSLYSEAYPDLVRKLDCMRLQPFEAPARRIEKSFKDFQRSGLESEHLPAIRRELHAALLVCVVERQVIRRLSFMTHRFLSESEMKEYRLAALGALDRIKKRVEACESFSLDARAIATAKLGHAYNILAQEELFETAEKRMRSADRVLKDLTAILPV